MGKLRRPYSRKVIEPIERPPTITWTLRPTFGFQQHRVHVDRGNHTRRFRLDRLRPPDLEPILGHSRVQREVLRLERSDSQPLLFENPAQRRDQNAFADR